ncbi:MAG: hypothetical protein R3F14_10730 [Polyangiaceae bacterium]
MRFKDGLQEVYGCRGRLAYILHRTYGFSSKNNNRTTLIYTDVYNPLTHNTVLGAIIDSAGRTYTLEYKNIDLAFIDTIDDGVRIFGLLPIPRLSKLVDPFGRSVSFEYGSGEPVLAEVAATRSRVHRFTYTYDGDHRLRTIVAPEQQSSQVSFVENTWVGGRIEAQRYGGDWRGSSHGGISIFDYTTPDVVVVTDPARNETTYRLLDIAGSKVIESTSVKSSTGLDLGPWLTRFQYNDDYQIVRVVKPLGNEIRYEYEPHNSPVTQGDVRNEAGVTYQNNLAKGNLTRSIRSSGTATVVTPDIVEEWEYSPLFNEIRMHIDPRGARTEWIFRDGFYASCEQNGQPRDILFPDREQPDGSVVSGIFESRTYYDSGLVESRELPGGFSLSFTYAPGTGYPETTTYPNGAVRAYRHDDRGNLVKETFPEGTPIALTITREYDLADLCVKETYDPGGLDNHTTYEHDLNHNVILETTVRRDNFTSPPTRGRAAGPGAPAPVPPYTLVTKNEYTLLDAPCRVVEDAAGRGEKW